jgi:hypothetical protein
MVWDIAAGILIALFVAGGFVYGIRQGDRGCRIAYGIMFAGITVWRLFVWYDAEMAKRHPVVAADLYAKYGLTPPPHQ